MPNWNSSYSTTFLHLFSNWAPFEKNMLNWQVHRSHFGRIMYPHKVQFRIPSSLCKNNRKKWLHFHKRNQINNTLWHINLLLSPKPPSNLCRSDRFICRTESRPLPLPFWPNNYAKLTIPHILPLPNNGDQRRGKSSKIG